MKKLNSIITKKGQITIPSYIRNKLHLSFGSKLEFVMQDDSFIVVPINKSINNLQGILPKTKMSLSIEDINEVIKGSMIGIDTNVLVRYLTIDDEIQSSKAAKLIN